MGILKKDRCCGNRKQIVAPPRRQAERYVREDVTSIQFARWCNNLLVVPEITIFLPVCVSELTVIKHLRIALQICPESLSSGSKRDRPCKVLFSSYT